MTKHMRKSNRSLLISALLTCSLSTAWSESDVHRTEDVIYGRKFGTALTMDVFEPTNTNACGILFLVNGGWLSSKATPNMVTIQPDYYRPFLERGYTVFAVRSEERRVGKECRYRWLRYH